MKKLIILIALLLIMSVGFSQQLYIGPTHTITWDAVIAPQGIVSYEIWLDDNGTEIFIEEITATTYMVDITAYENVLNIGVSTLLTIGTDPPIKSIINWSNENGVYTPIPFELWQAVPKVKNMRIE